MREIKFRAWDNQREKFFTDSKWVEFTIDNNGSLKAKNYTLGHKGYQSLEIVQYTGLKDKNGIEIYEGDIVSCQNKIGQVKYEKSMFIVDFIKAKGPLFSISNECIVVGNIYENKDLLKKG